MRIDSSGNVGIGTSSPVVRLDVNAGTGNIGITTRSTDPGAYISFVDDTTTDEGTVYAGAVGNNFVTVAGGAERMRITSGGSVGIGTTSPAAKLSVDGSAIFNESGADVDFRVESETNTHALFLDAENSRVGINRTPSFPLDVEGTAYFRGTTASEVTRVFEYKNAKTYIVTDSLASGGKTRLSFSGGDRRSCVIELTISGTWGASTVGSNHPAAKYIMRALTTSSSASLDGPTALYEYVYSSASHFTFTDQGSGDYTIDITNPTGDSTVAFTYKIEILNAAESGAHSLTASSTI